MIDRSGWSPALSPLDNLIEDWSGTLAEAIERDGSHLVSGGEYLRQACGQVVLLLATEVIEALTMTAPSPEEVHADDETEATILDAYEAAFYAHAAPPAPGLDPAATEPDRDAGGEALGGVAG